MIIILSAPSGCGKSSLSRALLNQDPQLVLSVSATTRQPRPGEVHGSDYFFTTKEQFQKLELLESAEIYGNFYGTPLEYVKQQLEAGKDVLFDIDSQGAYQLMNSAVAKIVSIFILPPNIDALRQRLQDRNQDQAAEIELRLKEAQSEMQHAQNYDYTVINDDFVQAVEQIQNIILNARKREQHKS
jgi:guanylate kinase